MKNGSTRSPKPGILGSLAMKIYTRQGDGGRTRLATGETVSKDNPRVELYGLCDELNSHLGLALAHLEEDFFEEDIGDVASSLLLQQEKLFVLGSELAGYREDEDRSAFGPGDVLDLEERIDRWEETLPPLRSFILPGGGRCSASLHVCRTVCRRLERALTPYLPGGAGAEKFSLDENIFTYVNRLSDYLFILARLANKLGGKTEKFWRGRKKQDLK